MAKVRSGREAAGAGHSSALNFRTISFSASASARLSQKGPVEILVIDPAEKPSEN
jgi:hypothetical protein